MITSIRTQGLFFDFRTRQMHLHYFIRSMAQWKPCRASSAGAPRNTRFQMQLSGLVVLNMMPRKFHFLAFEQLSGDLIGSCVVTNRGSALGEDGVWNLGYWIRSSSEGRGFC